MQINMNLSRQMERFLNQLDLFHVSIWEKPTENVEEAH